MARRSLKRRQLEIFEEKLTHDLYGPTDRDPGLIWGSLGTMLFGWD